MEKMDHTEGVNIQFKRQPNESNPRWKAVDEYTFSHMHSGASIPSEHVLSKALELSRANGLPNIAVSPSQGKYLMLQARSLRAQNILEVGTLGGYSTIWLASASPGTRVTTIEIIETNLKIAAQNLRGAGLDGQTELLFGSALDILPRLLVEVEDGKRPKWDLVFIDADKQSNWEYFDLAVKMSRSGAVIIVDNVVMKGTLVDEEEVSNIGVQGNRRVVEMVGKDSRVEAVVLQTVGEKIYDGFIYAIVN